MNLTLGFSPCPNDTFIFDALVNKKIDTGQFTFTVLLEDVQTLNRLAIKNELDVTKLSYGVWPLVIKNYIILNSGSALGTGVGPLLIAKSNLPINEIQNCTVAIPGENTTAHLLFSIAFPKVANKIFIRYDEIEDFIADSYDNNIAGVIIHENRFTYQDKGLKKIIDLGEFWEGKTGKPIPLGGIVAKRNLDKLILNRMDVLIKQSIEYAFTNYPVLPDYVKQHSSEMEEEVMRKHIDLYVNQYSLSLGEQGENAIEQLLDVYKKSNTGYELSNDKLFFKNQYL